MDNINKVPELCKRLLHARGVVENDDINDFLFPKLTDLPQPGGMKGLFEAAELVRFYIENQLQIVVWGDYDVDGTSATGLLANFFKEIGIEAIYHIPNRLTEGYGLNTTWFAHSINSFSSKNFLLITVDCGISNTKEIKEIQKIGGEVIVTDHHSIPPSGIPECIIINPAQADCGFHGDKLAGVGVAFYLAAAIRAELTNVSTFSEKTKGVILKNYLAFVALGTVADLVEVTKTNRILIRAGFEAMRSTIFPGLKALLSSCGLYDEDISTEDIGFLLGPKINAAGRLGKSEIALKLFLSDDEEKARKHADKLENLNQQRKSLCEDDFEYALTTFSKTLVLDNFLCVCHGEYHLGVAGIVASRLVEELHVPAVVFARVDDAKTGAVLKGSIRSVEGISVIKALNSCTDVIEKYGGHEMAAGLTVLSENLTTFSEKFSHNLKKQLEDRSNQIKAPKATRASVDEVMSRDTLLFLSRFEPFGPGNEPPLFVDKTTRIIQARTVGKLNSHLNLTVRGKYSNYKGIGFNLGDRVSIVQDDPERTLYFAPTKNRYRGTVSWQLRVVDVV